MSAFMFEPGEAERFVLVHVPKTGVRSLRNQVLGSMQRHVARRPGDAAEWPWERSVVVLRDPMERFLSGWWERCREWPLEEVLEWLQGCPPAYGVQDFENATVRHHLARLTDAENFEFVVRAKWRLSTETLDDEWPGMARRLGLAAEAQQVAGVRVGAQPDRRTAVDLSVEERRMLEEYLRADYEWLRWIGWE